MYKTIIKLNWDNCNSRFSWGDRNDYWFCPEQSRPQLCAKHHASYRTRGIAVVSNITPIQIRAYPLKPGIHCSDGSACRISEFLLGTFHWEHPCIKTYTWILPAAGGNFWNYSSQMLISSRKSHYKLISDCYAIQLKGPIWSSYLQFYIVFQQCNPVNSECSKISSRELQSVLSMVIYEQWWEFWAKLHLDLEEGAYRIY